MAATLLAGVAAPAAAANYDVIVYRATPAGITAAVEAGRHGKRVLLVEASSWLGGMTASGLGVSDEGDSQTITGLAKLFYQDICAVYYPAGSAALKTCQAFDHGAINAVPNSYEPHAATAAFRAMLGASPQAANIAVKYDTQIVSLQKSGTTIVSATLSNGAVDTATVFIDAGYEGDLLKLAGVSYTVGREPNALYGESQNGWLKPAVIGLPIDPYVVAGDPQSGLVPGLSATPDPMPAVGSGDDGVMAYTYRLCVTNVVGNTVPFAAKPLGYSETTYALLMRYLTSLAQARHCDINAAGCVVLTDVLGIAPDHAIPNGKIDMNADGPISTDVVGLSAGYPDGDAATRMKLTHLHRDWIQGLLYFLQNSANAPSGIRAALAPYGLCKDEFTDTGHWPHQLYVREARRMIGEYVVTEKDIYRPDPPVADPVALASDRADAHDTARFPVQVTGADKVPYWTVALEGGTNNRGTNPFPISYAALVPRAGEASNLLAAVTISASHSAYRILRMEPVYMMLGHAAGAGAVLAIDEGVAVQNVDTAQLETMLASEGMVVAVPAILKVQDAGANAGGTGRNIRLIGQYPGVLSQYTTTPDIVADSSCCWPSEAASTGSACTPSTTAITAFSATEIDLVLSYGAVSATPYCKFNLIRHDPAVDRGITSLAVDATLPAD
jgi:hypothetical protein